jgi:hypothetical protein
MEQALSKYHSKRAEFEGIKFDSGMEMQLYKDVKSQYPDVEITLQPKFILQEGFKRHGETVRPITYVADFEFNGRVVDVKGVTTPLFMLEQKMFWFMYPDLILDLITKCPIKYQHLSDYPIKGWITLGKLAKLRKENKKCSQVQ